MNNQGGGNLSRDEDLHGCHEVWRRHCDNTHQPADLPPALATSSLIVRKHDRTVGWAANVDEENCCPVDPAPPTEEGTERTHRVIETVLNIRVRDKNVFQKVETAENRYLAQETRTNRLVYDPESTAVCVSSMIRRKQVDWLASMKNKSHWAIVYGAARS